MHMRDLLSAEASTIAVKDPMLKMFKHVKFTDPQDGETYPILDDSVYQSIKDVNGCKYLEMRLSVAQSTGSIHMQYAFKCDYDSDQLISLKLAGHGLTGTIDLQTLHQTSIGTLDLTYNNLAGIQHVVGIKGSQLHTLKLDGNREMHGRIRFPQLAGSNLKYLSLGNALNGCTKLRVGMIGLSQTNLEALLVPYEKCTHQSCLKKLGTQKH